jgi:hypothetical protein
MGKWGKPLTHADVAELAQDEVRHLSRDLQYSQAALGREQGRVEEKRDLIRLLLALEPGLEKYRVTHDFDGARYWDTDGMKDALEFRRLQDSSKKYASRVVSETTPEKKEK